MNARRVAAMAAVACVCAGGLAALAQTGAPPVAAGLTGVPPLTAGLTETPKMQQLPEPNVAIRMVRPFAQADRLFLEVDVELKEVTGGFRTGVYGRIYEWPKGETLWEGPVGIADFTRSWTATVRREIADLKPKVWTPETPHLYAVAVSVGTKAIGGSRFGFRSVENRDGQIWLNGRPVFLRGHAINPPGRGMADKVAEDKAFAVAYIREMKARNVNCLRTVSGIWLDACDEEGMWAISGHYEAPPGSSVKDGQILPPLNLAKTIEAYKKDLFQYHAMHPSVIINVLANEMPGRGHYGEVFDTFLDSVYGELRKWDPTRLYLTNAGLCGDRTGDLIDWHSYLGWSTGNFLGYYELRRMAKPIKPLTFSESVGAYTEPGGRFRIFGRQLAAALAWGGCATNPVAVAEGYQSFLTQQTIEICRRLRSANPNLAALFVNTTTFRHWEGVSRFSDMVAKPVADQLTVSFQPVLLSWELWTPQVYAGATLQPVAHIVNDDNAGGALTNGTLTYALLDASRRKLAEGSAPTPAVPYYAARGVTLKLELPAQLATGDYLIEGRLTCGGRVVATNRTPLFVAQPAWTQLPHAPDDAVALYDPSGRTASALGLLGFKLRPVTALAALEKPPLLVIGEEAWDAQVKASVPKLRDYVRGGGRLVILRQEPGAVAYDWLGVALSNDTAVGEADAQPAAGGKAASATNATEIVGIPGMWINPVRPAHPVFHGLARAHLRYWSDPTGWQQQKEGHPPIYPVRMGFKLTGDKGLERTAILANHGLGLEKVALCEVFMGEGSAMVCGFDLVLRTGVDPVADRLLGNLMLYGLKGDVHFAWPLVEKPVRWGDCASEAGLAAGPESGLLINVVTEPVVKADGAKGMASTQTIPRGRRPYGPFAYDERGAVAEGDAKATNGVGRFWARLPAGCKTLLTTVENPADSDKEARLTVSINGQAADPETIAAGKTRTLRTPLPAGTTGVAVQYEGSKHLVLLTSEFK